MKKEKKAASTKKEILEREHEKTLLLLLSGDMAAIRNKDDFFDVIWQKIKPMVGFEDAVISIYSKDFTTYKHFVTASPPERKAHDMYKKIVDVFLPVADNPDEYVFERISQTDILRWDTNEILTAYPAHFIGHFLRENNLLYNIYQKITWGGNIIGFLNFHFSDAAIIQQKKYGLYKSIADQIAVVVANILANEEILEREREKTLLLSISSEIAQIRDLNTLVAWLHQKAATFIKSDYVTIDLINKKQDKVRFVWGDVDADWQLRQGLRKRKGVVDPNLDYKNSFFEYVGSLPEGTLFSIVEMDSNLTGIPIKWAAGMGIRYSFLIKLVHNAETIGHICFHANKKNVFEHINLLLLQNIANQVTFALLNIVSNEAAMEREKQKNLGIQINNAVLANSHFKDVVGAISNGIGHAVGCDICYIRIFKSNLDLKPFHFFSEKFGNDYLVKPLDEKLIETGATEAQGDKNAETFLSTLNGPAILSGQELENSAQAYRYLHVFTQKIGIKSFMFQPLILGQNGMAYLIIGSRTAYAYIQSDLDLIKQIATQLSLTLDNRLAFHRIRQLTELLEHENYYLQEEIKDNYNFNEIIGDSLAIKRVFEQAGIVANTDTTVLLGGETGTGKELIARAIHNISPRRNKPMIKINCACLPPQLIESELFGHEKGAFTGAVDKRIGKFELANGSTIFLDEIGELPLDLQAKLLRVIQERQFERIGGKTTLKTDIRIIAATNKDLLLESNEKRFRSDLYYRLNVFPISLPPLRHRKEDIPLLALHFAQKFAKEMGKKITALHSDTLHEMMAYDWPGNIRELEHVVEHSVICCNGSKLVLARPLLLARPSAKKPLNEFHIKTLDDNEREHILNILKYCNGRIRGKNGAAQLLDIHPNTLESRMHKLHIKKEHVVESIS